MSSIKEELRVIVSIHDREFFIHLDKERKSTCNFQFLHFEKEHEKLKRMEAGSLFLKEGGTYGAGAF